MSCDIYDPTNHGLFCSFQLLLDDHGDADKLVVTTTKMWRSSCG
jgi:hypothetical protein